LKFSSVITKKKGFEHWYKWYVATCAIS